LKGKPCPGQTDTFPQKKPRVLYPTNPEFDISINSYCRYPTTFQFGVVDIRENFNPEYDIQKILIQSKVSRKISIHSTISKII
jgi:hypothetical protein